MAKKPSVPAIRQSGSGSAWAVKGDAGSVSTRSPKRSELIAEVLRREIIEGVSEGRLVEGDPLPNERDLLARFDVARPTLREAMRILESDALVEFRVGARGGAYVRLPHAEVAARHVAVLLQLRETGLRDVWRIRAILEPAAVRLATENRTAEGVARLREIAMQYSAVAENPLATVRYTSDFLFEIVHQSKSPTLEVLCTVLHDILDAQLTAAAQVTSTAADVKKLMKLGLRAMERVTDLIESGEADAAGESWAAHVNAVTKLHMAQMGAGTTVDAMA